MEFKQFAGITDLYEYKKVVSFIFVKKVKIQNSKQTPKQNFDFKTCANSNVILSKHICLLHNSQNRSICGTAGAELNRKYTQKLWLKTLSLLSM